jgi:flavin reductase (DIM6/NTAB) family NADH-FMN oxidoreductase RutF
VSGDFDALMGALDYPMFIVTVARGEERAGCLVGFATHASIDPPRFLTCLSKRNRTYRLAREADALAVHLVPETATGLAELFGGETGDELDKFARCEWRPGPRGLPLLDQCESWFCAEVVETFDVGDHLAFLLEPFEVEKASSQSQLPFERAKRIEPGHEA